MPATGGCFDKMPVAKGDVPMCGHPGHPERRRPARRRGDRRDLREPQRVSDGHDACQPIGVRWVEPVLQGTNPVIVHPNALGESEMAAPTMAVLRLR